MQLLIAEDDVTTRRLLELVIGRWGYDVISMKNGKEAWDYLTKPDSPNLIILDRMMPEMDGLEVCRRIRQQDKNNLKYVIHLTTLSSIEDIVAGLDAGADDYITKPFNNAELHARIKVGERMIRLQSDLRNRVEELKEALDHIQRLQGILPICSFCHKIRDDRETWQKLEEYVEDRSEAKFSHSYCPECLDKHYPDPDRDPDPNQSSD